jgi:hypothetical protein
MLDFVVIRILRKYPFLGTFSFIGGLILLPVGLLMLHNFDQLRYSPSVTTGIVETLPQDTHDGGNVTYKYHVGSEDYQNTITVSRRELDQLNMGGSIVVHYQGSDPASSLTEGATPHIALTMIGSSVALLLFPLYAKISRKRQLRRQQRKARA